MGGALALLLCYIYTSQEEANKKSKSRRSSERGSPLSQIPRACIVQAYDIQVDDIDVVLGRDGMQGNLRDCSPVPFS